MPDPLEPDPMDELLAGMPDVARQLASFTASLENHGYTRIEAIRLTGDYLRAHIQRTEQ